MVLAVSGRKSSFLLRARKVDGGERLELTHLESQATGRFRSLDEATAWLRQRWSEWDSRAPESDDALASPAKGGGTTMRLADNAWVQAAYRAIQRNTAIAVVAALVIGIAIGQYVSVSDLADSVGGISLAAGASAPKQATPGPIAFAQVTEGRVTDSVGLRSATILINGVACFGLTERADYGVALQTDGVPGKLALSVDVNVGLPDQNKKCDGLVTVQSIDQGSARTSAAFAVYFFSDSASRAVPAVTVGRGVLTCYKPASTSTITLGGQTYQVPQAGSACAEQVLPVDGLIKDTVTLTPVGAGRMNYVQPTCPVVGSGEIPHSGGFTLKGFGMVGGNGIPPCTTGTPPPLCFATTERAPAVVYAASEIGRGAAYARLVTIGPYTGTPTPPCVQFGGTGPAGTVNGAGDFVIAGFVPRS